MSIYSYLKKDHEKVATLFEAIVNAKSETKRDALFLELKEELTLHADAEHETLYKVLKKHEATKKIATHSDKEHMEVKEYLEKLSKLSSHGDKWLVLLGELKYAVEHHVEEEEKEMFAQAKKVLNKETEEKLLKQIEEFKEQSS